MLKKVSGCCGRRQDPVADKGGHKPREGVAEHPAEPQHAHHQGRQEQRDARVYPQPSGGP